MNRRDFTKNTMGALFGVSVIPAVFEKPKSTVTVWPQFPDRNIWFFRKKITDLGTGISGLQQLQNPSGATADELGLSQVMMESISNSVAGSDGFRESWESDEFRYWITSVQKSKTSGFTWLPESA
jgi:hypothetical protein